MIDPNLPKITDKTAIVNIKTIIENLQSNIPVLQKEISNLLVYGPHFKERFIRLQAELDLHKSLIKQLKLCIESEQES